MMNNASQQELYQEMLVRLGKEPHNYYTLEDATHSAEAQNMLCGDEVRVFAKIVGDRVEHLTFTGYGCALMKASASLMTDALAGGRSLGEHRQMIAAFHQFIKGSQKSIKDNASDQLSERLYHDMIAEDSSLRALEGVRQFPARIQCVLLPWTALQRIIDA